jgi:hypothetical protein
MRAWRYWWNRGRRWVNKRDKEIMRGRRKLRLRGKSVEAMLDNR